MKEFYEIKSDRYDRIHKFVIDNDEPEFYRFQPEHEWMTMNIIYGKDITEIKSIDSDGGPTISKGWSNGEIQVEDIKSNTKNGIILFRIKECH